MTALLQHVAVMEAARQAVVDVIRRSRSADTAARSRSRANSA